MEPGVRGRVERRLAAILAADVAGYSGLMGQMRRGARWAKEHRRGAPVDPKTVAGW